MAKQYPLTASFLRAGDTTGGERGEGGGALRDFRINDDDRASHNGKSDSSQDDKRGRDGGILARPASDFFCDFRLGIESVCVDSNFRYRK